MATGFELLFLGRERRAPRHWRHLLEMSWLESVRPFMWVPVASAGPEPPGCLLQLASGRLPSSSGCFSSSCPFQEQPASAPGGLLWACQLPPGLGRAALSCCDRRLGSKMERFSWQPQIFNHESNLI